MKTKTTVEIYTTLPFTLYRCNKCELIFRPPPGGKGKEDDVSCPNGCREEGV